LAVYSLGVTPLLPDRLRDLYHQIRASERPGDDYEPLHQQWLAEHRAVWESALVTGGWGDLKQSLLAELGRYADIPDLAEVERLCRTAPAELAKEWDAIVRDAADRASVESFYNKSKAEIFGLLWWHTLVDDDTPLSYVLALQFAQAAGGSAGGPGGGSTGAMTYLDFGSGVGSGAVLFKAHGFDVTCADISSPMLDFCRFRIEERGRAGRFIDLKTTPLPDEAFDFVTAMDVFEHLYDPVDAIERLYKAMRPGGHIYGRWAVEQNDDRRGHIVQDMTPTHERMTELGLVQVWRDDWCWGHEVYRKER
jgi:SAM-dependent methyltransferase